MERDDPRVLLAALAARESRAAAAQDDRRQFTRHTVRGEASLQREGVNAAGAAGAPTLAYVRDASRGGLGLVSKDRLEVGRSYRVVCSSDGVEVFSAPIVVRHAQPISGAMHVIGALFVSEGAWLMSLGVGAAELRSAEPTDEAGADGEFSGVAA